MHRLWLASNRKSVPLIPPVVFVMFCARVELELVG
jgi:hypothetical protein